MTSKSRECGNQRNGGIAKRQTAGCACLPEAVEEYSPRETAQAGVNIPLDKAVSLAGRDEVCSNRRREDRRRRSDEIDLVRLEAERAGELHRTLGLERTSYLCVERSPEALRGARDALDRA